MARGAKTADAAPSADHLPLDPELQAALSEPPLPQYDVSLSLEAQPLDDLKNDADAIPLEPAPPRDGFSVKAASLFFGNSLGAPAENMESWQPGEGPDGVAPAVDPDMKLASLPLATDAPAKTGESGESIAPKGQVNADNQH